MFDYDVTRDYVYDFNSSRASIVHSSLSEDGHLKLPTGEVDRTLLLEINLQPSWAGRILQPYVVLHSGALTTRQYFEYGAEGRRYLNLTPFAKMHADSVKVAGQHTSVLSGDVRLIGFENTSLTDKRVMVLAPHPDDAEIAAFGLYSMSSSAYIVTVTAGEAGPDTYDELYKNQREQYVKKGMLRTWDSIITPMLGGVPPEHCVNLGYFDGTLQKMYGDKNHNVKGLYTGLSDPGFFRKLNVSSLVEGLGGGANWNALVNNLAALLKKIQPEIIVTVYPSLDRHPDHKYSTTALSEAIKKVGLKKGKLFLYATHYPLSEYFPYGEQGSQISLPPHFDKPFYFDTIFSLTLSHSVQTDKLLAFEQMHDLRLDTEWMTPYGACKWALRSIVKTATGRDWKNYYKRFVRANELFYVVDIANMDNAIKENMSIN